MASHEEAPSGSTWRNFSVRVCVAGFLITVSAWETVDLSCSPDIMGCCLSTYIVLETK